MGFITCVMMCCTQVLIPDKVWTDKDQKTLDAARLHCRQAYGRSPCLVKFKRVEESVYSALCGANNNE